MMLRVDVDDVAHEAELGDRASAARSARRPGPTGPRRAGPCTLSADTMSPLTLPISTIWAISRVSASVTRWPSTNSVVLPSRPSHSPICGPPPWTTTGRMPTWCISTTSAANWAEQLGRRHGVAAELHDDDRAPEALDVRQRLEQHLDRDRARRCATSVGASRRTSPDDREAGVSRAGRPSGSCTGGLAGRPLHEVVDGAIARSPCRCARRSGR